tara:strand:+ start:542 stop:706 length:165 start_codon:yes stop_codon:yes gene_type:complete
MPSYRNPLVSNIIVDGSIDRIINSLHNVVVFKKYSPPNSISRLETIKEVDEEQK